MVIRRLFFNFYIRYVFDRFESHKSFLKILVSGISKIDNYKENIENLKQQGIIKEINDGINNHYGIQKEVSDHNTNYDNNNINSVKKDSKLFFLIDFDILDNFLIDFYVSDFLKRRYSISMQEIYKSICKCTIITPSNILNNLQSTKLLIKDGITFIHDINNIEEYFKYLINLGILRKDFDGIENYKKKVDQSLDLIKIEQLNKIIKDPGSKRLLNMFYKIESLLDSEVLRKSLLQSSQVKKSLILLHKFGILNLEFPINEGSKHPNLWRFNFNEFTKGISKELSNLIEKSLENINKDWDTGNIYENESFLIEISKFHYFSEKFFIFSKKF
ncbi:hypothetical protein NBO_96g0002 [Nosema bombycis CQ1]|uniref:DNA-directed RNA polymerase III subunit RPC3 n=1 Tax=Nosema bombycis (strain CQ1 / CVCC 102059) TaxID=578461 RepID=R0MGI3_NOSB1|nr:hypothetical protein NBO_96g0002 [Nosema bombycis CQ1]|eukprot:EOB13240.1 hypothetical protein NBO_96g0002 [Nosema bombycis CQ1]